MDTLQCWPGGLRHSVDLRIQTYTEPILLKYGKLATKYPWIYRYFLQCSVANVVNWVILNVSECRGKRVKGMQNRFTLFCLAKSSVSEMK